MINIIENLEICELKETNYIKPVKVKFTLNGVKKTWEAVISHDSVSILLYHTQKKAFLLVKQFRIPVYLNDENIKFTFELCAGLIDKDKSVAFCRRRGTCIMEELFCDEIGMFHDIWSVSDSKMLLPGSTVRHIMLPVVVILVICRQLQWQKHVKVTNEATLRLYIQECFPHSSVFL